MEGIEQIEGIATLSTVIGATFAAGLLTEAVKRLVRLTPWRPDAQWYGALSLMFGIVAMLVGVALTQGLALASGVVGGLNGIIAGLAASKTYDQLNR